MKVKAVKIDKEESVGITTEFIKLDSFLKLAGVYPTGGEAKAAILGGGVRVNGEDCIQRGKKLRPGDKVAAAGRIFSVTQKS